MSRWCIHHLESGITCTASPTFLMSSLSWIGTLHPCRPYHEWFFSLIVMSTYCMPYSFGFLDALRFLRIILQSPTVYLRSMFFLLCSLLFSLSKDSTKALQFSAPFIDMRPTTYVETTSFGNLCLSLRVTTMSRHLAIGLICIMLLRMWPLPFVFATISPTMVMTTSLLLSSRLVGLLIVEVWQNIGLHDSLINSTYLSALQPHHGPILQSIHEVEQHIFIDEVGNLKRDDGELLHICVNASHMLKLPKLELLMELLPSVDGTTSIPYFKILTPPPKQGYLWKI